MTGRSRFDFRFISHIKNADDLDDTLPCVVLAAPAMLQNGMSRELFDRWASNPLNGVIIPGYTVENTLAKQLFSEPKDVQTLKGQTIPRKCSVHSVSFSGHSDFVHTSKFVEALKTKRVVLIHGVATEMERLRERLTKDFAYFDIEIYAPGDCETVSLPFKANPTAVVRGALLDTAQKGLAGLIIRMEGLSHMIVAPSELSAYSTLQTLSIDMKQQVRATRKLADFRRYFERHFSGVSVMEGGVVTIGSCLTLEQGEGDVVSIEWRSDPMSDLVADNVAMMLACADPAKYDRDTADLFASKLALALQCRWGAHIELDPDSQAFMFQVAGVDVMVAVDPDAAAGVEVECENPDLVDAIRRIAVRLFEMARSVELPRAA